MKKSIPMKDFRMSLVFLAFTLLAACAKIENGVSISPTVEMQPSPVATAHAPTAIPLATSSKFASVVIQTLPDISEANLQKANFSYNQQVTDGRLMMFAEAIDLKCHKITILITYMDILISFQNRTSDYLYLAGKFWVSLNNREQGGDIIPLFFKEDGSRIRLSRDEYDFGKYEPTTPLEIPPQSEYRVVIKVPLPTTLPAQTITLIPEGRYIAKLIYNNSYDTVAGQDDIWTGMISSNLIEFCMEK